MPALFVALLVLAACGGPSDMEVEATNDQVEAVEPSVTPAPTAAADADDPGPEPSATPEAFELDFGDAVAEPTPSAFSIDFDMSDSVSEPFVPDGAAPGGGVLGAVDNEGSRWKYVGVLGELTPSERVVPPAAPALQPVAGLAPLTGLPASGLGRPAVIIKIDNVNLARPHVGLNEADIVYEELVESGITRFAAVYHSNDVATVGPVRSGRSTDIGIVSSFNMPIFAFSGANSIYEKLIDASPIVNRGAEVFTGYWRQSGRPAPHNLFTSTATMWNSSAGGAAPLPHFAYRAEGAELHPSAVPASQVQLRFLAGASYSINYEWSDDAGGWRRWQSGTPHTDVAGAQVAPENLVVQYIEYIDSGLTDKWGEDLYEGVSVGTGSALIFTQGHMIEATWTRPSLLEAATYTDADGNHIELTAGRTWVALVPPGGATWS